MQGCVHKIMHPLGAGACNALELPVPILLIFPVIRRYRNHGMPKAAGAKPLSEVPGSVRIVRKDFCKSKKPKISLQEILPAVFLIHEIDRDMKQSFFCVFRARETGHPLFLGFFLELRITVPTKLQPGRGGFVTRYDDCHAIV